MKWSAHLLLDSDLKLFFLLIITQIVTAAKNHPCKIGLSLQQEV